jgi:hypothetical protein
MMEFAIPEIVLSFDSDGIEGRADQGKNAK